MILLVVNLFQSMAAFMANTTLPLFSTELGASVSTVGIITSSFTVSALLVRPFAGPAFDSFSRRNMLLGSQAIIALSMFLYGIADSIEMLICIRLLHGIGIGCGGPLAMSLVSEYLPKAKFASGISIYTLAQSCAQVVGPAVGLQLFATIGHHVTYFLACGSVALAMAGVFFIKEPYREKLRYEFKLDRMFAKEAVFQALALMLLAISFSCMTSYVVLYGFERGIQDMGIFFMVYAACLLGTRPAFGTLADKLSTPRMLVVGVLFFGASYLTLSQADSLPMFIAAAVLGSAGFGCCAPLLQSYALAAVSESKRGAASNTTFTGLDLGMLIGPTLGGFVTESMIAVSGTLAGAYSTMWLVMMIPAAGTMAISVYWILSGRRKSA